MGFVALSLQYEVWGITLLILLNLTLKSDHLSAFFARRRGQVPAVQLL